MNHIPLVTVVIPLYNGAQYIRRSVQSVLAQTYTDFELVVVDDGSMDCGGDIVRAFTDPRIRMVCQDNAGVSAARNKGIAEGWGRYVAFLDADDEWDSGFLDAVVNLTTKYPQAGIYGTGYRMVFPIGPVVEVTVAEAIDQQASLLVTDYFYRANGGSIINASGVMIPNHIFGELGAFKVGEHHGEDLEMWARIALRYSIGYDTRVLFSFYQTPWMDKPRLKSFPKYDTKVEMLQDVLIEYPDYLVDKEMIRSHVKNHLTKMCFSLIVTDNQVATVEYMHGSNATIYTPLLNKLIKYSWLWRPLRLFVWLYRLTKSRVAMKIIGGQRVSHGVLVRV